MLTLKYSCFSPLDLILQRSRSNATHIQKSSLDAHQHRGSGVSKASLLEDLHFYSYRYYIPLMFWVFVIKQRVTKSKRSSKRGDTGREEAQAGSQCFTKSSYSHSQNESGMGLQMSCLQSEPPTFANAWPPHKPRAYTHSQSMAKGNQRALEARRSKEMPHRSHLVSDYSKVGGFLEVSFRVKAIKTALLADLSILGQTVSVLVKKKTMPHVGLNCLDEATEGGGGSVLKHCSG